MSAAYSTSGSATRTRGRFVLSVGILASHFSRGYRGDILVTAAGVIARASPKLRTWTYVLGMKPGSGDRRRVGQPGQRVVHVLLGELDVLELAGVVGVVGGHVEVAMTREP